MKHLFCPWRSDYTVSVSDCTTQSDATQCVFCIQPNAHEDDHYFILKRGIYNYVMLNRYPYNAGHLLIIPYNHIPNLEDCTPEAQVEMIQLCTQSTIIVKKALKAQGVNIGINMGRAAGAGIPDHLHMHVLPRWTGDTNFLPTLTKTKQISFDLQEIYQELKPYFE